MTEYRVRWQIAATPSTYSSGVMETLEEAYEYRDSIKEHTTRIWIEAARWEVFDEAAPEPQGEPSDTQVQAAFDIIQKYRGGTGLMAVVRDALRAALSLREGGAR